MRKNKFLMGLGVLAGYAAVSHAAMTVDWTSSAITKVGTNFTLHVEVNSDGFYELISTDGVPANTAFSVSGATGIPSLKGKAFALTFSSVNGQDIYTHDSRGAYRIGIRGSGLNPYRFDAEDEVVRVSADLSSLGTNITFGLRSFEELNSVEDYVIGLRDSSGAEVFGAVNQSDLSGIAPELSGGTNDWFEFRAVSGSAGGWGSLEFEFGLANAFETPIELANIFSSGCVLQRDKTVPVWGTCEPGETITVSIRNQSKTCTADANGNWRVELAPEPAGGAFAMTISGERSMAVVLTEVYFGDVWLLTGQSNMFLLLGSHLQAFPEYYPPVPDETDDFDDVRFAIVDTIAVSNAPAEDVIMDMSWTRWEADQLFKMSTVGYFFVRKLNEMLDANGQADVPLGFIKVCRGATAAEQWMASETLAGMGEPLEADENTPASIYYNGMIAPLQDYAIKGAVWYQGESNSRTIERIEQYPLLWQTLVESWRDQWGIDFPFYYVQLAPFMKYSPIPRDDDPDRRFDNWAWMRESQAECRSVPDVEMACIINSGFQNETHPPHKDQAGKRLARIAAAKTYGIETVYRGPMATDVQFNGSDAMVTFGHVAEGLETRSVDAQPDAEEIAEGFPAVSVSEAELAGFALCGSDQVFYWADAEIISSNQVRVFCPVDVPQPVALRYAWQSFPRCNLFNSEGLPAEPFRTDTYEYGSSGGAERTWLPVAGVDFLIQPGNRDFILRWDGTNRVSYTVEASTNLVGGIWEPLVSPLPGIAGDMAFTGSVVQSQYFYRVCWR